VLAPWLSSGPLPAEPRLDSASALPEDPLYQSPPPPLSHPLFAHSLTPPSPPLPPAPSFTAVGSAGLGLGKGKECEACGAPQSLRGPQPLLSLPRRAHCPSPQGESLPLNPEPQPLESRGGRRQSAQESLSSRGVCPGQPKGSRLLLLSRSRQRGKAGSSEWKAESSKQEQRPERQEEGHRRQEGNKQKGGSHQTPTLHTESRGLGCVCDTPPLYLAHGWYTLSSSPVVVR